MARKNRNARPRVKRRSVKHLFRLLTPDVAQANAVYFTLRTHNRTVRVIPTVPAHLKRVPL